MSTDGHRSPAAVAEEGQQFGCRIGAVDPVELFHRYQRAGFLYPAKRDRLTPYWSSVLDTWRRSLEAGEQLHYLVTGQSPDEMSWASLSVWRTSLCGWQVQHLVSSGGGAGARAVLSTAIRAQQRRATNAFFQSWFRPENPFADALFGTVPQTLGPQQAVVQDFQYLALPLSRADQPAGRWRLTECWPTEAAALAELAHRIRGPVYTRCEELNGGDLGLAALDELYRSVGLRRYRRVWLAHGRGSTPVGAALAHRGPLGLNFSFLENRCDLLITPDLPRAHRVEVAAALCHAVRPAYLDFAPAFIPITTDVGTADFLERLGARPLQRYAQCIWRQSGLTDLYRHVDAFYRHGGLPTRHPSSS
jgi:hypothetical protein